jgi:hypothetical protein
MLGQVPVWLGVADGAGDGAGLAASTGPANKSVAPMPSAPMIGAAMIVNFFRGDMSYHLLVRTRSHPQEL